jgi:C-terminal processing protease CtpA/Prc
VQQELCSPVDSAVGAGQELGYIRVATFNKQTPTLFLQALQELKRAGADSFLIDLRNNGGGYFPAGVQVRHSHSASGAMDIVNAAQRHHDGSCSCPLKGFRLSMDMRLR